MDRGHPPLDFPFYGLPPAWVGPRWVESITGPLGHPADGIWLRHGSALVHDARSPWLRVGTLRGDRFPGTSRESRTAFSALFALVDATMPSPADRPPDYTREVGDVVAEHADRHAGPVFPSTVEESRRAAGADPGAEDDVWWPAHEDHVNAMT